MSSQAASLRFPRACRTHLFVLRPSLTLFLSPTPPHPTPPHPHPHPPTPQDYERAFAVFERVVCLQPQNSKAWVSWAQAEKRATRESEGRGDGTDNGGGKSGGSLLPPSPAAAVLQAGLTLNRGGPPSATAPLAQAWALLELQRGNARAAVALLARAVREDPEKCSPVLRWAPVVEAAREAAAAAEEERRRRRKGSEGGSAAVPRV